MPWAERPSFLFLPPQRPPWQRHLCCLCVPFLGLVLSCLQAILLVKADSEDWVPDHQGCPMPSLKMSVSTLHKGVWKFCKKNIPATFQRVCSCCHLLLPLKFQLDPGFLFTSCSKPLSDAHYPPAVAQLLHSTSKVAACTWRASWFPHCFLPWCIKPSVSSFCKQLYKCQVLLTVHVRGGKVKGLGETEEWNKTLKIFFSLLSPPLFFVFLVAPLIWIPRLAFKALQWPSP